MAASRASTAKPTKKWSQHVTETSDAMDLKPDIFKSTDPKQIARSVKSSAEHSDRRKSDPYRSAMSMITFYVNRAGHNLDAAQHRHLEDAKDELRALFGRPGRSSPRSPAKPAAASKAAASKPARRETSRAHT